MIAGVSAFLHGKRGYHTIHYNTWALLLYSPAHPHFQQSDRSGQITHYNTKPCALPPPVQKKALHGRGISTPRPSVKSLFFLAIRKNLTDRALSSCNSQAFGPPGRASGREPFGGESRQLRLPPGEKYQPAGMTKGVSASPVSRDEPNGKAQRCVESPGLIRPRTILSNGSSTLYGWPYSPAISGHAECIHPRSSSRGCPRPLRR